MPAPTLYSACTECVVSGIVAPKDVHAPIPRTCDYVTLHDKGDFADVIKDLEMGRLSWVIPSAQCHHKGPHKSQAGGSESEKGDVRTEAEAGGMSTEDGGGATSQGMRAPLEAGKGPETDSPRWSVQKEQPCPTP